MGHTTVFTYPGHTNCPTGWTAEYVGYGQALCLDTSHGDRLSQNPCFNLTVLQRVQTKRMLSPVSSVPSEIFKTLINLNNVIIGIFSSVYVHVYKWYRVHRQGQGDLCQVLGKKRIHSYV